MLQTADKHGLIKQHLELNKEMVRRQTRQSTPHKNQSDIDKALRILELEPGGTYSERDIKKAYRRLAMIHHPDLEGGSHAAFVKLGTATEYLLKFGVSV